jgi:serine/threonine-protein kinase
VVGALNVLAVVVALMLWATISFGGGESTSTTTVLPADAAAADADATDDQPTGADGADGDGVAVPVPAGSVDPGVTDDATIVDVIAYDPEGDGIENDAAASQALADGDPDTAWRTVCYASQFMGAKRGVGLVLSFDAPTRQAISVDVLSAPYQLQFFATADETIPPSLDGWGPEVGTKSFGPDTATVVSAQPPQAARHVLVLLNEIGADTACTGANPFRGELGEIALVS